MRRGYSVQVTLLFPKTKKMIFLSFSLSCPCCPTAHFFIFQACPNCPYKEKQLSLCYKHPLPLSLSPQNSTLLSSLVSFHKWVWFCLVSFRFCFRLCLRLCYMILNNTMFQYYVIVLVFLYSQWWCFFFFETWIELLFLIKVWDFMVWKIVYKNF